ncbi:WEB family protein At1g75720 [Linum grandiflorum]
MKRAEVDTRAPFRSVKEAVTLFGEKILAGELYPNNKLKQQVGGNGINGKLGTMTSQLEETKQSLEKAKEESTNMANCLSHLKQELEQTKQELQRLKQKEVHMKQLSTISIDPQPVDVDIHHRQQDVKLMMVPDENVEFQKKRYVTFANNPSSIAQGVFDNQNQMMERHPSLRRKKKKPLIPLIGGLFSSSKRKGQHHHEIA